eukprot:COSAG01_NODE_34505_length_546_cov_1.510067_2_plen_98_part_01
MPNGWLVNHGESVNGMAGPAAAWLCTEDRGVQQLAWHGMMAWHLPADARGPKTTGRACSENSDDCCLLLAAGHQQCFSRSGRHFFNAHDGRRTARPAA